MRRMTILLLFLYAGLTVYTILRLVLKEATAPFLTPLLTFLAFAFAGLHAIQRVSWRKMILLLVLCFGVSLTFESIGVSTGLIYGPYHYSDMLGAKFLGLVPYLIPLAWFMMMYPSLVIAEALTGINEMISSSPARSSTEATQSTLTTKIRNPRTIYSPSSVLATAAIAGLIMTAWDLALDPMMVSIGHWVWDGAASTRPYFGVPLQNFFGWWLTTFITISLYLVISQFVKNRIRTTDEKLSIEVEKNQNSSTPVFQDSLDGWGMATRASFDRLAVLSYLTTALGNTLTALLVGLGGPALVGFFAMSPWIILVWPKLRGQGPYN